MPQTLRDFSETEVPSIAEIRNLRASLGVLLDRFLGQTQPRNPQLLRAIAQWANMSQLLVLVLETAESLDIQSGSDR